MNAIVAGNKLKKALPEFEAMHGPVDLLGLFLRDDSVGGWDVIAAADWLKPGERSSYDRVVKLLQRVLSHGEIIGISGIVILGHGGGAVRAFVGQLQGKSGLVETFIAAPSGAIFRQAYVVVARRPKRMVRPRITRLYTPVLASGEVTFGVKGFKPAGFVSDATPTGVDLVDFTKSGIVPVPTNRTPAGEKTEGQVDFIPSSAGATTFPVELRASAASK